MDSGLYLLLLRLASPERVTVGALGSIALEPGWYIYVGSARRALRPRVARHLAPTKPRRWHIDYLTTLAAMTPVGAVLVPHRRTSECALNRRAGRLPGVTHPIPGFGASDCRRGCPAHLGFSPEVLTLAELVEAAPTGAVPLVAASASG